MQVNRSDDDLKARSLIYASRLLESQLERGERFRQAKRVFVTPLCTPTKRGAVLLAGKK